ncbi:hypothetical protein Tdes44962_MAKER03017 [Teratosphaeria destructans]|uniref:Uncharacterized protein n=1 Tax=Teratosphaeria destructans TaxID=418781 RepID=A0A9W7SRE4_9PEZI|nr:hypothetical protein Tdes44962_MAKER03017 [Teratosphaeria destructans]
MLQFLPARSRSASECLEKVREIESALWTIPRRSTHQAISATPTEKASALTTPIWVPKDGRKRQRSLDSNSHADSNRRKTVAWYKPLQHGTTMQPQTYDSSNALSYSNRRSTEYESVLGFLRGIQIGADHSETPDLRTTGVVQTLCHQLERLEIDEIKAHTDHNAKRTILTAVTKTREFTLANLTSSDLANSIADLACQLTSDHASLES